MAHGSSSTNSSSSSSNIMTRMKQPRPIPSDGCSGGGAAAAASSTSQLIGRKREGVSSRHDRLPSPLDRKCDDDDDDDDIIDHEQEDVAVINNTASSSLCSQLQDAALGPIAFFTSSYYKTKTPNSCDIMNNDETLVVHRTEELIELHVDVLSNLLNQVVAQRRRRTPMGGAVAPPPRDPSPNLAINNGIDLGDHPKDTLLITKLQSKSMAIDEISEVIHVPQPPTDLLLGNTTTIPDVSQKTRGSDSPSSSGSMMRPRCEEGAATEECLLSSTVKSQLRHYITRIADMYLDCNPFHNFAHASHVTFSAFQLLQRIVVAREDDDATRGDAISRQRQECAPDNHTDPWKNLPFESPKESSSAGILASNSLAQFALVFSALIHDVDHRGVPNTQLAKENPGGVATKYHYKSIAEQNSVDIAWELLEEESFQELRVAIFSSEEERAQFRNMVVNVVLATDICDPGLREFRERKWVKAFSSSFDDELESTGQQRHHSSEQQNSFLGSSDDSQPQQHQTNYASSVEERSRKASVVMDLIIQAADISHTMQPFDTYLQWNERLYREMYTAYHKGRSQYNPSSAGGDQWYQGELMFYDKHIIPLAIRLQDSGMFGLEVGEALLKNARNNRTNWEVQGREISAKMQEETERLFHGEEIDDNEEGLSSSTTRQRQILSWPSFLCCRSRRTAMLLAKKGGRRGTLIYGKEKDDSETDEESDDDESSMDQQSRLLGSAQQAKKAS